MVLYVDCLLFEPHWDHVFDPKLEVLASWIWERHFLLFRLHVQYKIVLFSMVLFLT